MSTEVVDKATFELGLIIGFAVGALVGALFAIIVIKLRDSGGSGGYNL